MAHAMSDLSELLAYMKDVLEGRDGLPPFARWLDDNEERLAKLCSRGVFLRLKNNPLPEFQQILGQHGIPFHQSEHAYLPHGPQDCSWMKSEWLLESLIPYHQSPTRLLSVSPVFVDELLHMIQLKQTGDELKRFSSPQETWENKCGREGIALVRDGVVVYAIVLKRN